MFDCGEQYALFHQAGRITHARAVVHVSLDLEIVEIGAAKYDSRIRRCRKQADAASHRSVETDTAGFDRTLYCELVRHARRPCRFNANRRLYCNNYMPWGV